MPTTASIIQSAEKRCTEKGVRLTEKRSQVLSGLLQSKKALSAYGLIDYCREHLGQQLPAMSVYRILDFLEGENLVHRLHLAKKYVACAHISCEHQHGVPQFLICSSCDAVEEVVIKHSVINSLKDSVADAGFHLASPQLEFECYCSDCVPKAG
jgi:Fur family zinc uptake transcriptional regulator